jgi:hypothetical protein
MFSRTVTGRLDPLVVTVGPGAGSIPACSAGCPDGFTCGDAGDCVRPAERTPIVDFSGANAFPDAGGSPRHRILRNSLTAFPPIPTDMLLVANPGKQSADQSFTLDFIPRVHEAFGGAIAAGMTRTLANQTLDATTTELRYFAEVAAENIVRITATPATPGMDVRIALLDSAEATRLAIDANGADAAETHRFAQNSSGFTAWKVTANVPGTYTLEVAVVAPFYKVQTTSQMFVDACSGGTQHTLINKSGTNPNPQDEGITDPIAAPAGFTYYGDPVTSFVASSNGFLSFDTNIVNANFSVDELPDGLGETHIAPAWDDLVGVVVCTKTTANGKLVVQWTGREFGIFELGDRVQFQAILDPANDSIEFVYGPNHEADGSLAVSGVQNLAGDEATQIGSFSAFIAPSTSKKLVH